MITTRNPRVVSLKMGGVNWGWTTGSVFTLTVFRVPSYNAAS